MPVLETKLIRRFGRIMLKYTLPIRLRSPNLQMHWTKKAKRDKKIALLVRSKCKEIRTMSLPCTITLTRCAPRELDYDNFVYSFKHIRDVVADMIKPGLKPGHADSDKRMTFQYKQKKTKNNLYQVQIKVEKN